jgi:hypothetical protein
MKIPDHLTPQEVGLLIGIVEESILAMSERLRKEDSKYTYVEVMRIVDLTNEFYVILRKLKISDKST